MDIIYEKKDRIACVTINRPDVMNAMSTAMQKRLAEIWVDIDNDPKIRVGILTGAGDRAFCAGADLKEKVSSVESEEYLKLWRPDWVTHDLETSKPMIAAINGYCLAGGQELALACDIRICSENAEFGSPEARWNLLHGYGTLKLVHAIPLAVAMEMILTGERINAHEAYRIGLVSHVVPQSELMPTAEKIAKRISENGPLAVKAMKELAYRSLDIPLAEGLRLFTAMRQSVYSSEDTKEGPRAFTEKRPPVFKGR